MRLSDDRPIAVTTPQRRTLARVMLTQGEERGLIAYGAADNHLHAELTADRHAAGDFANYVMSSLRRRLELPVPFEKARIRPVEDQRHAYRLFFYAQRQDTHHDTRLDPRREATSLQDLLGLRALPTKMASRVRAALPRLKRYEIEALLPVDLTGEPPLDALELIASAAAAAFALPDLTGRSRDLTAARRAAVHAIPNASPVELAMHLGVGAREIQKLRAIEPEPRAVRALQRQLILQHAIGQDSLGELEAPYESHTPGPVRDPGDEAPDPPTSTIKIVRK